MYKKEIITLLAVLFVSLIVIAGCDRQQQSKSSGKKTKIGLIAPFSGDQESWGKVGLIGSKVALKLQPILLNGNEVEIVVADDQNNPEKTKDALHKLVEEDKVSAIMILSDSDAVLAVAEQADMYKTPILALISSHPEVTRNSYVSQLVFDDTVQGTIAALYVMDELYIDHVAVFNDPESPHSTFLAEEFSKTFEDAGGIVERVTLWKAKNDYPAILKTLRDLEINFLYLPLNAEQVITIETATRDILWKPQVLVSDGLLSQILLEEENDLALVDGMLAIDIYSTITPKTDYGIKALKTIKKIKQSFDTPGTTFAGVACEGTSILLAAMDRCGDSSDRECINRMLRSTKNFTGLIGKISINKDGKVERPAFVNVIEDRSMKFVVKVY